MSLHVWYDMLSAFKMEQYETWNPEILGEDLNTSRYSTPYRTHATNAQRLPPTTTDSLFQTNQLHAIGPYSARYSCSCYDEGAYENQFQNFQGRGQATSLTSVQTNNFICKYLRTAMIIHPLSAAKQLGGRSIVFSRGLCTMDSPIFLRIERRKMPSMKASYDVLKW